MERMDVKFEMVIVKFCDEKSPLKVGNQCWSARCVGLPRASSKAISTSRVGRPGVTATTPEESYYAAGSKPELKASLSQKSSLMENQLRGSAASRLSLVQQPLKEVQQKPFLQQPKLKLVRGREFSDWPAGEKAWPLLATAALLCPEVEDGDCGAAVALEGNTTVEFSDDWANFSNLAVSRYGQGFRLEFSVASGGLNATEVNVTSGPFDVLEYSLEVTMHCGKPSLTTPNKDHFRMGVHLYLRDAITKLPPDSDILNATTWRYILRLQDNGSPVDVLSGDTTGNFPAGKNRTQPLNLNLTSIGYRYQLNATVDSPLYATAISSVSPPFDALRDLREKDKHESNISLTFNGTVTDIEDSKEEFYTTLLNNLGHRYSNVHWQSPEAQKDKDYVVVGLTLVGRIKELVETKNSLWVDAKNHYRLPFGGAAFALQPTMTVDGSAFYGTDPPPNSDMMLSLTTIFTITLMSFLCASFVIAVLLWRIREKRVMESYNRRMRSRKRTNGHVNTAFDSNESVQTRNEVYLIALNERAKERARASETEPLRRCSSGGIPRNYRRAHRGKLGSDDEEQWGALGDTPIDDDMVFVDTERHDEVYRDVFFSPNGKPCRQATFNSSSTSFQDDYLMRDVPGPSGSSSHKSSHHRYGRRKCSVTASTPSGSLTSLPNSRAGSRMWANSMSDNTYSLVRPPVGWSSHDDKRMCNGKNLSPMSSAIC